MMSATQSQTLVSRLKALQCHFTWDLDISRSLLLRCRDNLLDIGTVNGNRWLGHIYNLRGFIQYKLGFSEDAQSFFNKAKQAFCSIGNADEGPWLVVNYGNLAWLHHHLGDQAESEAYLSKIDTLIKKYPSPSQEELHPETYAEKAYALMTVIGDKTLAVDNFQRAMEMQPGIREWNTSHALALMSASMHSSTGLEDDILEKMRIAQEQDPENLYLAAHYLDQRAQRGERIEAEAHQELKNVIDKLAQFVARNGPEFEKMTMEKQKDNPKFSFLFGGDYFSYYKCKLAIEHQQHPSTHDGEEYTSEEMYQGSKDVVDILPPPMAMIAPLPNPPPAAPSMEDLIQQSQWNLQQQEQHMHTLRQEQVTAAIALAMEQQTQKLLLETQLDITEFDNLLQPIIDTCTKDAISGGKNWMFNNAKTPQHCELMTSHLRNRITADGAHFELCLHLIYLTNDVLHHCQRKQQKDLLAALQKVVVPIYCTSFLAVEEDKQQKITRLLQLWEKNGYFNDETIQMLQNPTLGLGQYQASLITEYAAVVQPIQLAFQQQIQALKAQHEEFVSSLKQQPQPSSVAQLGTPAEPEKTLPMSTKAGDVKPPISGPPQGDFDGAPSRPQDPSNPSGPSDISSNKAGWYDPQHMGPWNPNQPPPFDPNQPPPPCPPWNSHEGMWNEQRNQENWSGGPPREGGPWSGPGGSDQGPPSWNSYDQQPPWGNQPDQPPWGQREPPFPPRMQRPPHFRGPFPPHQQPPPFNQPPPPHSFGRFPPRFMQDDFPPRHHYDRPPYTPHRFDYAQGEFPGEMPGPPPHHHQNQRLPPPGMGPEHPPWGGSQHQDFGPPPHGFNGHSPHVRHRQHPVQDDPSLVPNVPYFDLPAGLMAPLVKLEDSDYKPLDPKDIRLPPPMPPSDRLLAAVEAFYSPPSHDRPRNSEGWEQNGLYEFFRAKMRAKRKKGHEKRNSVQGDSRSRSPSHSRGRSSSRSSSRSSKSSRSRSRSSGSHSQSRSRSYSRSRSRSRSRSSRSRSRSRSRSHSPSKTRHGPKTQSDSPPSTSVVAGAPSKLPADSRLGEENKGHQLLMKMGWSGSGGLGAKEQGIQDPIKGGDIRDKWDQYKGVGVSLDDPYENYRRNKSYNFVARMKAREEVNRETPEAPPTE